MRQRNGSPSSWPCLRLRSYRVHRAYSGNRAWARWRRKRNGSRATDAVSAKRGGEQSTAAQSVAKPAAAAAQRTRNRDAAPALPTAKRLARTRQRGRSSASSRRIASAAYAPRWLSCLLASKCTLLYLQLTPRCYPWVSGYYAGDVAGHARVLPAASGAGRAQRNGGIEFTRVANAAPYWGSIEGIRPRQHGALLAYSTPDHWSVHDAGIAHPGAAGRALATRNTSPGHVLPQPKHRGRCAAGRHAHRRR